MKLGLMQPYFAPYPGYFDLINMVDEWIVFDTAQYKKNNWVNRNRVLHPQSGWWYITVPVKKFHYQTPINEIEISEECDWRKRIFRQLQHYKKKAPYYDEVINFLKHLFDMRSSNLSEINTTLLKKTCAHLGITTPFRVFSEMDLVLDDEPTKPGDWAMLVSKALGAAEYINRPGGASLFDEIAFEKNQIKLTIQDYENMLYTCHPYQFEPGLSIIDALMWNTPQEIKAYLDTSKQTQTEKALAAA